MRTMAALKNKPKMLGLVKKAGKLQRLNCLEAERVLYVLDQFRSRLLLLTGLHGSLASDVVHFPQVCFNIIFMTAFIFFYFLGLAIFFRIFYLKGYFGVSWTDSLFPCNHCNTL